MNTATTHISPDGSTMTFSVPEGQMPTLHNAVITFSISGTKSDGTPRSEDELREAERMLMSGLRASVKFSREEDYMARPARIAFQIKGVDKQ
jgi:hypothetical protein